MDEISEQEENDADERFSRGARAAHLRHLSIILQDLGYLDEPEALKLRWLAERENIVDQLRMLCDDFGDNEWSATDYLPDVVEKRLGKYLYAREKT